MKTLEALPTLALCLHSLQALLWGWGGGPRGPQVPHSPSSVPLWEPETPWFSAQLFLGESHRKNQLTRFPFPDVHTLAFAKWSDWSLPSPPCAHLPSASGAAGMGSRGPGAEPSSLPSASSQFLCTVIAILLHYVYMSTFAWTFVEGLHVYRMLTEVRNIDTGPMRFYYVVGWGIPAIITGEDWRSSPGGVAWAGS